MDALKNSEFMNLPGPSEINVQEERENLDWPARLAAHRGVAEGDVPLLIRALGVHRDGVDLEARRNLRLIFGHDLGGKPDPWLGWWRQHLVPGGRRVRCSDRHCTVAS